MDQKCAFPKYGYTAPVTRFMCAKEYPIPQTQNLKIIVSFIFSKTQRWLECKILILRLRSTGNRTLWKKHVFNLKTTSFENKIPEL